MMNWTGVFAYPLAWRKGRRAKGAAAYERAMDVYHSGWRGCDREGWAPDGKDLAAAIAARRIKRSQVLEDARQGRILLRRCASRADVTAMVDAYHHRASMAVIVNSERTIMDLEDEFRRANAEVLSRE